MPTDEEPLMPMDVIESLEILVFEAIGMTAVALATVSAGELTLAQWRALVVLGRTDGMRVGAIAQAVGMSLPSTSRLIQRLERQQLVTTERDESDRRATLVRMTPKGADVRQAVVACRREMMVAALQQHAPRLPRGLAPGLSAIATAFDRYR
jgi:DNA-binding MarR family transcriptional regulator